MASGAPNGSGDAQTWLDLLRVWAPGVTPAALLGSVVAYFRWRSDRKTKRDEDRDSRVAAEASAEATERRRLDEADAAQLGRHTAEIARKDAEIAAMRVRCAQELRDLRAEKDAEIAMLKKDRDDGWRAAVAGSDGWRKCRHEANEITARLCLTMEAKGLPYPDPPPLAIVPDLDTLAGRKP